MKAKIKVNNFNFYYSGIQALKDINVDLYDKQVTAFIGPSGCGKSTLLRSFNRMNDMIPNIQIKGDIILNNQSLYNSSDLDVFMLRKNVGMVFQKSNPFPKSIYNNVAYGPRIHGIHDKETLDEIVEDSLKKAYLWNEVKDRLKISALRLSGGQQQRLCIARSLAVNPEILLMDEPTSALDPRSTIAVEELIKELIKNYTILIVTHNMQQASRVSDRTAFFFEGVLVEVGDTEKIFNNPDMKQTEDYIIGRFG